VPLAQKISDCTEYTITRKQDVICKKTWAKFKEVAKAHHLSPSALLCTIYAKVLERWSNQQDMVLNLTAFERKPFHKDVEKIIGDFTKLLPLALSMNENDLWKQASDVQTRIMDGLEHLSYDGTEIMRELAKSRNQFGKAILPVVFTCVLFDAPENYYEVLGKLQYSISQTPQIFIDNQIAEMGQKLFVTWDVVKEIFNPEVIDQIFKDFVENIRYIANGENSLHFPELKTVWNNYNPKVGAAPVKTLHGLVNNAMQNFTSRIAVAGKDSSLTYAELDALSNRIANYLHENGVIRGDRVAVLGERIPETIASILGILKAGGVYVPIDISYPKERVDFIMQDGNCKFLLKKSYLESKEIQSYSEAPLPTINTPKDEAYIIYTSGSTGKPKGVIMQHGATANTIIDVNERLALKETDTLIGISSICFDLSVYDIFGALSCGAKLALVSDARDMREVCQVLAMQGVTIWNSVPVLFDMAMKHRISANDSSKLSLRKVLLSGDRIPLDICTTSKNAGCNADLISLGGATEAAIWSIIYPFSEVRSDWDCIPYGYPMKNQTFYVLNANLKLCPPEVQGDLYIGGVGLAKGYNNDPEKTSKAFIDHPKLGRIYRTGDLGKLKTEGFIEFLGRSDTQIKLNGFRIELGEIEAALMHTGLVTRAVAALKDVPGSGKQIVAYVLGANGENVESTLKAEISKTLTGYMIPSRIVSMESFPLSANGKVDKKQLPIPELSTAATATSTTANENISDEERAVLEIWQNVFENPNITLEDDFYSIGGDSITLMKLVDKMALDLNKTVNIDQILQAKNIKEFITLI
jgi:amino acid adenylation domain-containing protein